MQIKQKKSTRIICVILAVVLFGLAFAEGIMISLQYLDSERVIKSVTENVTIQGETLENIREGKTTNKRLAKMVTNMFDEYFGVKISDDDAAMFLEEFDASAFVSEYLNKFTDYLKGGGKIPRIEIGDYIDMLEENEELISLIIGRPIEDTDYYMVKEIVKALIDEYNEKCDEFNEANTFIMKIAGSSYVSVIAILGVIIALLITVMIVMYKFSKTGVYRGLRAAAVSVVLGGAACMIIYPAAIGYMTANPSLEIQIVEGVIDSVCKVFVYGGLAIVVAGAVLAVAAFITGNIYKKNQENA